MKGQRFWVVWLIFLFTVPLLGQPADSLHIRRLAAYSLGERNPMSLVVQGSYGYLADDEGIFSIVNLSNLDSIYTVGQCSLRNSATFGLAFYQHYAWVTLGSNGIDIVDCSNPSQPVVVRSYYDVGLPLDVAIQGSFVYVASWYALDVYHIINLDSVLVIGSYFTSGDAVAVKVRNNRVYLADNLAGFRIYDCSNPYSLVELGSNNGQYSALNLDVQGDLVTVASGANALNIYSVANPAQPQLVGRYTEAGSLMNVAYVNQYAYLCGYGSGLHVVNLANLNAIHRVGYYNPVPNVWKALPIGNLCYTLENGQLGIYDVSVALPVAEQPRFNLPTEFQCSEVYPNPFNLETKIQYQLPTSAVVEIQLYDPLGRKAQTLVPATYQTSGVYSLSIQGNHLSSGVYFLSFQARAQDQRYSQIRKLVLLK